MNECPNIWIDHFPSLLYTISFLISLILELSLMAFWEWEENRQLGEDGKVNQWVVKRFSCWQR